MNRDYEALSAFLDGETSELETRRVLRDLDQADIATLGRWQLASDPLRGHASREVPPAFNARLSAALAAESKPAKRAGMMGGFARVAVAASVAAATVIGWQYWSVPAGNGAAVPTMAANDGAAIAVGYHCLEFHEGQTDGVGAVGGACGEETHPPSVEARRVDLDATLSTQDLL